jgi:ABC-type transporter Mla MlaB component
VVEPSVDTTSAASSSETGIFVALAARRVLRIIRATGVDGTVVLRLVGRVRDQWVEELRHLSSEILQTPATRLVLDLAEVTFIDAGGLELLRELSSRHVSVTNCSLFVTEQLKALEEKR